jgi:hypothetical protein
MLTVTPPDRAPIPEELADAPVIQKPYTRETIENALARLKPS